MTDFLRDKIPLISPLELIKSFEGFRAKAYLCSSGVPTIGWGSTTYLNGKAVKLGEVITQQQADEMLENYYRSEVKPLLDKLPSFVTHNQKSALASLIYNWHARGVKSSKLLRAIIVKDITEIIRQWDYGFINKQKGLYKRRVRELDIFISDIDTW